MFQTHLMLVHNVIFPTSIVFFTTVPSEMMDTGFPVYE